MALAGLVELVVIAGLLYINAKSWYYYAKVRQWGSTSAGLVGAILVGTFAPFAQVVGVLAYRRRKVEYLAMYPPTIGRGY